MSKHSPVYRIKRDAPVKKISKRRIKSPKLKHAHTINLKLGGVGVQKLSETVRNFRETEEERLETLVSVEREYIKHFVGVRTKKKKVRTVTSSDITQKTPDKKPSSILLRKKPIIGNVMNLTKSYIVGKYGSSCSSPRPAGYNTYCFKTNLH